VSESSNFTLRSLAYEELAVRYRIDVRFETAMPVDRQERRINEIAQQAVGAGESIPARPVAWVIVITSQHPRVISIRAGDESF
jgi:hypothetical protein